MKPTLIDFLPPTHEKDKLLDGFLAAMQAQGMVLYPHQEEAILELFSDKHVILNTPTGSGKSLVALALHFKGLFLGKRSFYTSPIKALVNEKFFALCEAFGPLNVGMMTGDATLNQEAPIICCTAEILANWALADFEKAPVEYVIMDEFHYYSDKERGYAWQIPLLTLKHAQFLLMSATLGNCDWLKQYLENFTGTKTSWIQEVERPVPLHYVYKEESYQELIQELNSTKKSPIYTVCFTQRECVELAQNTTSINLCTKEEKKSIDTQLQKTRFDTPFGKVLKRLLPLGIGIHHAGLLPKYRLLVEKLAQTGLLKVIMGTDTLGVGINIPIRTVLFYKLCKFDGQKTIIVSKRDFKQIAGRAGRKGFDEEGLVIALAPEHVIENKRLESKFLANNKKTKLIKKQAPETHYVHWDEKTFYKLVHEPSESLVSQFRVTHGMMIILFQHHQESPNLAYKRLIELIERSHESVKAKTRHKVQSVLLLKALIVAGIVQKTKIHKKTSLKIDPSLQIDFSLHHSLSLYLIEVLPVLDESTPDYLLNLLSLAEAITEDPHTILHKQVQVLRQQKLAELRAQGLSFEERQEELEKIEHPKPLSDLIYETFGLFRQKHPWVGQENVHPKSIARDILEKAASFNDYIVEYGLERSEGLLYRHLNGVYKILEQTIPDRYKNDLFEDMVAQLRLTLAKVDTSLLEEWQGLSQIKVTPSPQTQTVIPLLHPDLNQKAFMAHIRAQIHGFLGCILKSQYEEAFSYLKTAPQEPLEKVLEPFFKAYQLDTKQNAFKHPKYTKIEPKGGHVYTITQTLCDTEGHLDYYVLFEVHWDPSLTPAEPWLEWGGIFT